MQRSHLRCRRQSRPAVREERVCAARRMACGPRFGALARSPRRRAGRGRLLRRPALKRTRPQRRRAGARPLPHALPQRRPPLRAPPMPGQSLAMSVTALPARAAPGPWVGWRAPARRPAGSNPLRARRPTLGALARPRRSPPRARRAPRGARPPPRPWAWAAASRRAARAAAAPPRRSRRAAARAPPRRARRLTRRWRTSRCRARARGGPRAGRPTLVRCSPTCSAAAAAAAAAAGPPAARAAAAAWRACWGACCSRLPWASWSARWPAARAVRRLCFLAPHHTFPAHPGVALSVPRRATGSDGRGCRGSSLCWLWGAHRVRCLCRRLPLRPTGELAPAATRAAACAARVRAPPPLARWACAYSPWHGSRGASVPQARGGPGRARRAGEAGGGLGGMLSQLGQAPGAGAPGAAGGQPGALMQQMMPMVANVRPPSSPVPRFCPQDKQNLYGLCLGRQCCRCQGRAQAAMHVAGSLSSRCLCAARV